MPQADESPESDYVLSRDDTQIHLDRSAESLAGFLQLALGAGVAPALEHFEMWAQECADGSPEQKWACVQACAMFARGMIVDAGEAPDLVAKSLRAAYAQQQPEDVAEIASGVTDALAILGSPGDPDREIDDEWVHYASTTVTVQRFVAVTSVLFNVALAALPAAARRANEHPTS